MTGSNIFLDSNIVIEIFSGNKPFADKIHALPGFYISSIVLGELYVGINRVAHKNNHLNKLNSFLELCSVLDVDSTTSAIFGELTAELYKKGKPIPTNDVWIAATVKQHDLTLVTRDKHFKEISNILIESW
jgi:tRNA(fMet)-specific endonuclease VapC